MVSSYLPDVTPVLQHLAPTQENLTSTLTSVSETSIFGLQLGDISGTTLAIIGAALAVGAAGIASAIGAGIVGSTGARLTAEDPKKFGITLLFQALPQTQGIYGFLIAILILLGAGVVGGTGSITYAQGLGAVGAGLAVGIAAVSAIGQGIAASTGLGASSQNRKMFGKGILFSVLPETQALYGFLVAILLLVGVGLFGGTGEGVTTIMGWGAIGAGLAVGLAGLSAIGQGIAAAGGIGAILQDAKSFGKSILFAVLPETQALYGFIVAILLLIGFGILGTPVADLNPTLGLFAIAAGLSVGFASISAIGQGMAASTAAAKVAEKAKVFGRSILFAVLPETQALYGFLIAVLLLVGGGLLAGTTNTFTAVHGFIAIGAGIAVGLAGLSAIGQGIAASSGIAAITKKEQNFGKSILFSIIPETQALYGFLIAILMLAGAGIVGAANSTLPLGVGYIAIGAGLAVGLGSISALGQGMAAASGISAVAKKASMFGKSIIFSIIPETQALMGFLIAILLLIGSGIMGAVNQGLTVAHGLLAIGAGIAVGLAAISAVGQGFVVSSGISATTRSDKNFGKSLLFGVLPQTQALYGFLIAILLLVGGGIVGTFKGDLPLSLGLVAIGSGIAVGLAAISAVGQGMAAASGVQAVAQNPKKFGMSILFSVLPETQALYGFLVAVLLLTGSGILGVMKLGMPIALGFIAIAAGLAVGLAALSALGQGMAASSAIASVTHRAAMFGKSIIFSIIPETQALMGFLIAILLLIGSGIMGTFNTALGLSSAYIAIASALAVGIAAISAFGQGFVVSSGISATTRSDKNFGKSLLFGVLPQTQALYGFLIAILLLVGGGIIGGTVPDLALSVGLIAIGAGLAVGLGAISAVGQGIAAASGVQAVAEDSKKFGTSILFSVLPETQALYGFLIAILLMVGGGILGGVGGTFMTGSGLAAIGAGLSVGLASLSAIGQGIAASSGISSVIEKSKMFGKGILFSVLPETQALYGIIIAVLLLTGVGLLGTARGDITILQGLGGLGVGLTIGLAAISAIGQGIVSSSSIGAALRSAKSTGKSLVLAVIPETYAIFGLLISILMLLGLQIL